jgi:hypothetical protein
VSGSHMRIGTGWRGVARGAFSGAASRPSRTRRPHSGVSSTVFGGNGGSRSLTLAELVETYLAQHDVQRVTIEKLRWC